MKICWILSVLVLICLAFLEAKRVPFVINTWGFTNATIKAWEVVNKQGKSAVSTRNFNTSSFNFFINPEDFRCCGRLHSL
jgi:hypothetical protein